MVSFSEFFLSVWVFPKRRFFFRLSFSPHRSVNGTPLRALEFFSPQNLERTNRGGGKERERKRETLPPRSRREIFSSSFGFCFCRRRHFLMIVFVLFLSSLANKITRPNRKLQRDRKIKERKRERERERERSERGKAKLASLSFSLSSRKNSSLSQALELPSFQLVSCIGAPAPRGWYTTAVYRVGFGGEEGAAAEFAAAAAAASVDEFAPEGAASRTMR